MAKANEVIGIIGKIVGYTALGLLTIATIGFFVFMAVEAYEPDDLRWTTLFGAMGLIVVVGLIALLWEEYRWTSVR